MGSTTKLLNVLMSLCDFAHNAISTPSAEKVNKETAKTSTKRRLIENSGERTSATTIKGNALIRPRTTPTNVFPMTIEKRPIGDIKHSSKHL
jgi:hypothetical protein